MLTPRVTHLLYPNPLYSRRTQSFALPRRHSLQDHPSIALNPAASALSTAQEESEYETDSEDEGAGRRLLKPVFVPKLAREVGHGSENEWQ